MNLNISLDSRSTKQLNYILNFSGSWDQALHKDLSEDLAKEAMEYFKPLLHVRPNYSGDLEKSIKYKTKVRNNRNTGFDIEYTGLFYGNYMDEGNADGFPGGVLHASSYGMKGFPVFDQRRGKLVAYSPTIHPMGHYTHDAVTHWAERTVDWLAGKSAADLAAKHMSDFLDWLVV
jgi:hypothetical protein